MDVRDLYKLKQIQKTKMHIRLANAKEDYDKDIKLHDPAEGEHPEDYDFPEIHEIKDRYKKDESDEDEQADGIDEVDKDAEAV